MKTIVHEKFEAAIYNPATRFFEGGSWHAEVVVNGEISRSKIKEIQNVIDEFDHSTIAPVEFITVEELTKINQRFTAVKNANTVPQMLVAVAKYIREKIRIDGEKIVFIDSIIFWRDANDFKIIVEHDDLVEGEIEVAEHRAV